MGPLPFEISPLEAKRKADLGEAVLIDVREPDEHRIASIGGAELIPMGTVPQRLGHLEGLADETLVVVVCHHGVRSMNVVAWLRRQGVAGCVSMAGGIERWTAEVDPMVPRY